MISTQAPNPIIIQTIHVMKYPTFLLVSLSLFLSAESYGQGTVYGGFNSQAPGLYAVVLGGHTNGAMAAYSVVLGGYNNLANSIGSVAAGYQSQAAGYYSVAIGLGAYAAATYSVSLGTYPVIRGNPTQTIATDPMFVVGIGLTATTRSNAMVVLKNGAVLIKQAGDVSMGAYTTGIKPDDTTP